MLVTLTKFEILNAGQVGLRRAISKLGSDSCNKINNKDYGWHVDIEAACAECALAKAYNWYWDGSVGTYEAPDVNGHQVRHTQLSDGKLILRPGKIKKEQRYYLLTGTAPQYVVRGYILGGDGMADRFLFRGYNGMPDCWMVPQSALTLQEST